MPELFKDGFEFDTSTHQDIYNLDNGMLPLNGNIPCDPSHHDAWDYRYLAHAADHMDKSETSTKLPEECFAEQIISTCHMKLMQFFDYVADHNAVVTEELVVEAEKEGAMDHQSDEDEDEDEDEDIELYLPPTNLISPDDIDKFGEYIIDDDDIPTTDMQSGPSSQYAAEKDKNIWDDYLGKKRNYGRKSPGDRQRSSILRAKTRRDGTIREILTEDYDKYWEEDYQARLDHENDLHVASVHSFDEEGYEQVQEEGYEKAA